MVLVVAMMVMITSVGRVRGVEVVVGVVGVVQGRLPTWKIQNHIEQKPRRHSPPRLGCSLLPPRPPPVTRCLHNHHQCNPSISHNPSICHDDIIVWLAWPQTDTRRPRRFPTFATSLVMNWPKQYHYELASASNSTL